MPNPFIDAKQVEDWRNSMMLKTSQILHAEYSKLLYQSCGAATELAFYDAR